MAKKKKSRLGGLPPKFTFCLNPYRNHRFTNCPKCNRLMKARKNPFLVHVDPRQPVILNMTGRYCPKCDLLILHQDKVEEMLIVALQRNDPSLIGNEYLVLGTIERPAWRAAQKHPHNLQHTFDNLHEFKNVVTVEVEPAGWYPVDRDEKK